MLFDLANDALRALGEVMAPHGPAVQAAKSFTPAELGQRQGGMAASAAN